MGRTEPWTNEDTPGLAISTPHPHRNFANIPRAGWGRLGTEGEFWNVHFKRLWIILGRCLEISFIHQTVNFEVAKIVVEKLMDGVGLDGWMVWRKNVRGEWSCSLLPCPSLSWFSHFLLGFLLGSYLRFHPLLSPALPAARDLERGCWSTKQTQAQVRMGLCWCSSHESPPCWGEIVP